MKKITVFVTYNPGNELEETMAVRLQTIGAVHGFNMLLPDRLYSNNELSRETEFRIRTSDYFILFSTSQLTSVVQQEITAAFAHLQDKSKIIIIYNQVKNLIHHENCTEVTIDAAKESADDIVQKVIRQIKANQLVPTGPKDNKNDEMLNAVGGILLIGLGFLALDALFNSRK